MNEKLVIFAIFLGFGLLEIATKRFAGHHRATRKDVLVEVLGTLSYALVTVPIIFFTAPLIIETFAPGSQGAWAHFPWWLMFGMLLIGDDMTQYWWHRAAHSNGFLYRLHRPHHSAEYMSIRIVYRNNMFYYYLMPGMWVAASLVHMGFGTVFAVYLIIKMTVIFGAHSSLRWDEWMYSKRWLAPLMFILERTISTPATHAAHHGKHKHDGVTHYKGNFGNLLFFWDVLFGTALITRRYPEQYGIENYPQGSWKEELLWPVVQDKREKQETDPVLTPGE